MSRWGQSSSGIANHSPTPRPTRASASRRAVLGRIAAATIVASTPVASPGGRTGSMAPPSCPRLRPGPAGDPVRHDLLQAVQVAGEEVVADGHDVELARLGAAVGQGAGELVVAEGI